MDNSIIFNKSNSMKLLYLIDCIDLSKCRLCQQNDGMIEIKSRDVLFDYITVCTKISMRDDPRNESLPKFICDNCASKLDDFFHFQKICLKIDEQLKELLEESKCTPDIIVGGDKISNRQKYTVVEQKNEIKHVDSDDNGFLDQTNCDDSNSTYNEDFKGDQEDYTDRNHTLYDGGPPMYICTYEDCTSSYHTKGAYMRHRFRAHNIRDFICKVCGKSFGRSGNLKDHEKTHIRAFKCPNCEKSFPQMYMLKTHIKLHHEGHRFYCPTCGQSFLTPHSLKRHELTHTGVKDFKCELCPLAFYSKAELVQHKQYHNDNRPFVCPICSKAYVRKNHLDRHMRIHTGERPYLCDIAGCQKSFMDNGGLNEHKRKVHHIKIPRKVFSVPRQLKNQLLSAT